MADPALAGRRDAERKLATILFADVVDSTALSRSIGLDLWWSVIARVFDDMCASITQSDGWVEGFTGDGIMAVFETSPTDAVRGRSACEHAQRAGDAALRLRDAIVRCAEDLHRRYGVALSVRIGLHSGEVVTGAIGTGSEQHYTAGGFAVGLAKRIETLAAPNTVYVTEDTAARLGDSAQLRDHGKFTLKGACVPVGVFELIGLA